MTFNNAPQDLKDLFYAFLEGRLGVHPSYGDEDAVELLWACWHDGYTSYVVNTSSY